ncbi:voltage-dependent anion-selective channel-like [Tropilaelaps mercedesae]|uniref:Voltage-dependent anion-selective channel-like n=1 Tax=Tropilaelaps mercedesae TaxID=418985 RepID=A0A1V9X2Z6_9ACAR|nr:voltage-dependent anion-selective channel-like [Tropilaelaps mercedesae]
MAPPSYSDLGKEARDIFSKNYHFGLVKLDCKTKSRTGIEFTAAGSSLNDTGKVNGSLDVKYKLTEHGITVKEKWTTDNNLNTEITAEDCFSNGLKLSANFNFAPQTGKRNAVLSAAFKGDCFNATSDLDYNAGSPLVNASLVLSHQGWLAGSQVAFDSSKNKLTKTNFAVGYSNKDVKLHSNVNDGRVFGASMYQKVRPDVQAGMSITWNSMNSVAQFGLGGVFTVDKDTSLRAKVNNEGLLGLGLTHRLRDGIQMTMCANIDTKNFNQGGHKIGFGLSLEG